MCFFVVLFTSRQIPFPVLGSLNGVWMFCKSNGGEVGSTSNEHGSIVWREFLDRSVIPSRTSWCIAWTMDAKIKRSLRVKDSVNTCWPCFRKKREKIKRRSLFQVNGWPRKSFWCSSLRQKLQITILDSPIFLSPEHQLLICLLKSVIKWWNSGFHLKRWWRSWRKSTETPGSSLWSSEEKSLQASNLNFFIIASQNGPARQTDESYSSKVLHTIQ